MCGIAGIVLRTNSDRPDLRERLLAMSDAMTHRGPDDAGLHLAPDGRAGLANRRLAIRDLSPAGHMPMSNPAGSVWITYNGEIYNTDEIKPELERLGFVFCSGSDTELILHGYEAWGENVVRHLRGMFAFAILDTRPAPARLFLARDRLGVKPLYYSWTPEAFLFASELNGLLASDLAAREISPAGLVGFLMLGAVPNPLTIYRDIRGLEPGCTLTLELDGAPVLPAPSRYWSLPTDIVEPAGPAEVVEQVRAQLEEAVRIRLVSDVPLGAFLSGGLDSSAVVALMRRATNGPIRTCSMSFAEADFDEAPYARAMAEAVGADHFERVIAARDVVDELDNILAAMDQPTVDGVNTYFVSQTAHQAGLTVALSGLGGDELFGGYVNTFDGVPQMLNVLKLAREIPGGARLAGSAIGLLPDRRLARVADAVSRPASLASAYMTRRGLFSPGEVKDLVSPDIWESAVQTFDPVAHIAERAGGDGGSTFAWVCRAELSTYTHHQLLRDTDVMSMAHSLEVRVPLLDHQLVETVLRLPAGLKVNGLGPKSMLLKAVGGLLPESIRRRREKQGFVLPFDRWLRGPLRGRVQRQLADVDGHGWLRRDSVENVWSNFERGARHWSLPWALAALLGWAQRNGAV